MPSAQLVLRLTTRSVGVTRCACIVAAARSSACGGSAPPRSVPFFVYVAAIVFATWFGARRGSSTAVPPLRATTSSFTAPALASQPKTPAMALSPLGCCSSGRRAVAQAETDVRNFKPDGRKCRDLATTRGEVQAILDAVGCRLHHARSEGAASTEQLRDAVRGWPGANTSTRLRNPSARRHFAPPTRKEIPATNCRQGRSTGEVRDAELTSLQRRKRRTIFGNVRPLRDGEDRCAAVAASGPHRTQAPGDRTPASVEELESLYQFARLDSA